MTTAAPSPGVVPWWVVVPLKDTRMGKSRIRVDPPTRQALARAMARDTVSAVLATPVASIGWSSSARTPTTPSLIEHHRVLVHLDRSRRGLNPAIAAGAALARSLDPGCHLAVLPADLPALTGAELDRALRLATAHPWAFVADQDGVGTTLLTARRAARSSRTTAPTRAPATPPPGPSSSPTPRSTPYAATSTTSTRCARSRSRCPTAARPARVAPDLCPVGSR